MPESPMHQKIAQRIGLFFVFVFSVGAVFLGVQWFSHSIAGMIIDRNNLFPASLGDSLVAVNAKGKAKLLKDNKVMPLRNWQVEDLVLQAPSAISVELSSGVTKVLYKKHEQKLLPVASLTKLMTALVVLKNYDLSQEVTISQSAMMQEGEQGELKLGQKFSVKSLLYTMLLESNNRGAYSLAEVVGIEKFVALMNEDAKNLGLLSTHFEDVTGLDAKSYSTAKDLAKLTHYIFENYPLFREIVRQKEYGFYTTDGQFHHLIANTNKLLGENDIIGGKTGFTDNAKGCFMVIQNGKETGDYIINVVLGSEDRFLEMQHIIQWLNQAYAWK